MLHNHGPWLPISPYCSPQVRVRVVGVLPRVWAAAVWRWCGWELVLVKKLKSYRVGRW